MRLNFPSKNDQLLTYSVSVTFIKIQIKASFSMHLLFSGCCISYNSHPFPFLFLCLQPFTNLNDTRPREGAKRYLTVAVSFSKATAERNGGSGASQTGNTLPFNQRQSERKPDSAIQTFIMLITLRLEVLIEDLAR